MPGQMSLGRGRSTRFSRRTDVGSTSNNFRFEEKVEKFYRIREKLRAQLYKDIEKAQTMSTLFFNAAGASNNVLAALISIEAARQDIEIISEDIFHRNVNETPAKAFGRAMEQFQYVIKWARKNLPSEKPGIGRTTSLGRLITHGRGNTENTEPEHKLVTFLCDARWILAEQTFSGASLVYTNLTQAYEASMEMRFYYHEKDINSLNERINTLEDRVKDANEVSVVQEAIDELEKIGSKIPSKVLSKQDKEIIRNKTEDIDRCRRKTRAIVNEMQNTQQMGVKEGNEASGTHSGHGRVQRTVSGFTRRIRPPGARTATKATHSGHGRGQGTVSRVTGQMMPRLGARTATNATGSRTHAGHQHNEYS